MIQKQHHALKAVSAAQGGEDRFPAGPRALLSWFQSGRKRIRKLQPF